jgi:hypothetical protein
MSCGGSSVFPDNHDAIGPGTACEIGIVIIGAGAGATTAILISAHAGVIASALSTPSFAAHEVATAPAAKAPHSANDHANPSVATRKIDLSARGGAALARVGNSVSGRRGYSITPHAAEAGQGIGAVRVNAVIASGTVIDTGRASCRPCADSNGRGRNAGGIDQTF